MSVNLIELVKGQLGDAVLDQLGGILGESVENTRNAVDAGVPTILGSIVDKVSSDANAPGMLTNVLDDLDDGIADDFTGFLQPEKQSSLAEKGAGLLDGLLGDNLGGVVDMISKFSGIGNKSSSSLLGMVLPLVLGFISKQRSAGGLDQAGLLGLLDGQKDHISQSMPSGMSELLGQSGILSGLTSMLTGGGQSVIDSASDAVSSASDAASDALSGAAESVADVAGSAKDAVTDAAADAKDVAVDAVGATTEAVGDAASAAKDAASNVASGAADAAGQAASTGSSMIRKILPIAAVVLVVLFLLKNC